MTEHRLNDPHSLDFVQYCERRSPPKGATRSFSEGFVGRTAKLQVSPPCVLPPLLIRVIPSSGLRTAVSRAEPGGDFGVAAAGSPLPICTVVGPPTPGPNTESFSPLQEYHVGLVSRSTGFGKWRSG